MLSLDLIVIAASVAAFSALVGLLVARLFASPRVVAGASGDAVEQMMSARSAGHGLAAGRHAREVREGLPDALDMIANSLSAGLTLPQAILRNLERFPPAVGAEMARVLYDTRLGFSIGGAFDNFAGRVPTGETRMVAIASKIGVTHGGKLHENYRMLSSMLRDNIAFARELKAMTTEGRMQAIVMSALPAALLAIFFLIRRELVMPLFTTLPGLLTLGVLVTMQLLAYVWIRKIVSIEV